MKRPHLLAWTAVAMTWPSASSAHGFGQRYDLPLPLSYYLIGSGLVVGLSFILLIGAARGGSTAPRRTIWHRDVDLAWIPGWLRTALLNGCRAFGVFGLLLVIVAGFIGDQSPIRNIAPSTVWVLTWVGLAFICALITNAWLVLNPWHSLYDWTVRLRRSLGSVSPQGIRRAYPERLGTWPAVFLFWCFAWSELAWGGGEVPANLAWLALVYSAITMAGLTVFGPIWLQRAEFFSIFFGLLGRFAPIRLRPTGVSSPDLDQTHAPLRLRPFGAGLVPSAANSASFSAFIVLMLSTVTFDGLMETPIWAAIVDRLLSTQFLAPILFGLRDLFGDVRDGLETVALVVFPSLAFIIFYCVNAMMRIAARGIHEPSLRTMALVGWFAISLLPIAIGYHFAHYLSFLLIAGQLSISLISDPLGFGWDLFGTARYRIDIGIINARTTWYVALVSIILGHIIAVILAHVTALRVFGDRRETAIAELPMIALMIGYTSLSLWILAQPIVE